jgi:xylulokinase
LDQTSGVPRTGPALIKYPVQQPEPGAATIDPDTLLAAAYAAERSVAVGQVIDGIGLSVFSPGWLFLDQDFQPLTPIITHLDRRARLTARQLRASHGQFFLEETGNPILPGGISGVVGKHLLESTPHLRSRTRHFWHLNSWLCWQLTEQTAMDPGNAAFTGLCPAMKQWTWSPRLAEILALPLDWVPPIRDGRATIGQLSEKACTLLGVRPAIPVKLGVADTSSAVLAARLLPGELLHVVGTTQVLTLLTREPLPFEKRLTRPLGVDSMWMQVTHNPVGGVALEWFHELCFRDQSVGEFFGSTLATAKNRPPGNTRLEPAYLGGDRLEVDEQSASFTGLSLQTDRLDLLAAILQAMRSGHEQALANLGLPQAPARVVITGGGAEIVRDLIPEYSALPIELLPHASLRGVARLFD